MRLRPLLGLLALSLVPWHWPLLPGSVAGVQALPLEHLPCDYIRVLFLLILAPSFVFHLLRRVVIDVLRCPNGVTPCARIRQQLSHLAIQVLLLPMVHIALVLLARLATRVLLLRTLVLAIHLLAGRHLLHILFKHCALLRSHCRHHVVHVRVL